jgi:7,8-dihydropterin-6-yl-methyl-4-(beta-D-ribofuranosyl)aminobenzene 5'-phosphate synthase
MTTVTVLAENAVARLGLLGEHGLAWWIDTGAQRVLFDAGQGLVLEPNARKLGVDLGSATAVALSHGHYDHVGALPAVLAAAPLAAIFLHPDACSRRYSGSDSISRGRRISTDFMEMESFRTSGRRVVVSREPQEIAPGLWLTGEVPRTSGYEDVGGPLFLDAQLTRPDPILDDQSLFFAAREGTVAVLGCAHAGLVNTLEHIRTLTHGAPIHTVVGGMHLLNAGERRLTETIAALRRLGVQRFGPNHCTGPAATALFWREFPGRCMQCCAGTRLEFM